MKYLFYSIVAACITAIIIVIIMQLGIMQIIEISFLLFLVYWIVTHRSS